MIIWELLFRFLFGGIVVLITTLIADITKNSVLTGIAATFPVMITSVAFALFITGYSSKFISNYFLGTLVGIIILPVFAFSGYYFVREYGFLMGLSLSLLIWFFIATSLALLRV